MNEIKQIKYINNNGVFKPVTLPTASNFVDVLPAQTYQLRATELMGSVELDFEPMEDIPMPSVFYGDLETKAKHITKSREIIKGNLGVLLYGVSGTGKTLLARKLCSDFKDKGYPVIVVNAKAVQHLEECIKLLKQPVVFLLDEFEKMFERKENQNFLLTILDGTYNTDHIFILTANDEYAISPYLRDRPSRIRYAIQYNQLSENVIQEVLEKELDDKSKITKIMSLFAQIEIVSFDVLFQIIKEINAYPDTDAEMIFEIFNISVSTDDIRDNFEVILANQERALFDELNEVFKKHDLAIKTSMKNVSDLTLSQLTQPSDKNSQAYLAEISFATSVDSESIYIFGHGSKEVSFGNRINGVFDINQEYIVGALSRSMYGINVPNDQKLSDDNFRQKVIADLMEVFSKGVPYTLAKKSIYSRFLRGF